MGESTKFLAKSPYIKDLAMMVIGYGMAINIVEVTWKSKLKAAFPDPNSYSVFMGNFSSLTGVVTLLMMIGSRTIFKVSAATSHAPKLLLPLGPPYLTMKSPFTALWLGRSSPYHPRNPTGHRSDVLQSQSLPGILRTHHS
jgi:TLC ATP/ADP transporter